MNRVTEIEALIIGLSALILAHLASGIWVWAWNIVAIISIYIVVREAIDDWIKKRAMNKEIYELRKKAWIKNPPQETFDVESPVNPSEEVVGSESDQDS